MAPEPFSPHSSSPRELKEQIAAERAQMPFLVYRDAEDAQRILTLEPSSGRLRVGRDPMCDLCLAQDDKVSRLHAELENVGDVWTLADHGLSRNGTFVNEERVAGQRVLHDGDVAGLSLDLGYIANEQAFVSLATVDAAASEPGTEVTVLWGERPNSAKPAVEHHRQVGIRATVAPAPFVREVRDSYRSR